ncbi:MAG: hypothetical protein JNN07_15945 [Verrucomicrobiales bacterium]|nr:hypothetical protein [Verrucomicrobiales bacterium]
MNLIHLHLALNHVPVVGTFFGVGLLAYALWRKSEEVKRVAMGVFVIVALMTIPVYLTGEASEDPAKELPGVTAAHIERHDQAAAIAFTSVLVSGIFAFVGLVRFRGGRQLPSWFTSTLLAASLIVSGLMGWTANLGGQIRHTEIRSSSILQTAISP